MSPAPLNPRIPQLNRLKALVDGEYITYFPSLTPVCGSYKAAAMLSVALAWTRNWLHRHPDRDGWFWKTRDDWQRETGLSRREQETARKALVGLGLLREARRGMPARLHYRLDLDRLAGLLARSTPTQLSNWDWDDPRLRQLLGRPVALYRRLTHVAGSLSGGLLLTRLLLTSRRDLAEDPASDGWIRYFPQLLGRHCQLTRHEVDGARAWLAGQGFLEARYTRSLPTSRVLRLDYPCLIAALEAAATSSPAQNANQIPDEVANNIGASRHPGTGKSAQLALDEPPDRQSANRPTGWALSGNSPSGAKPHQHGPGGPPSRAGELRQEIKLYPPPAPSPVHAIEVPLAPDSGCGRRGVQEITATAPSLVFSGSLLPAEQTVARAWLAELAPELRQLVLDEHAGMMRNREIRNPLGYLRTLIDVGRAGRFLPTIAYRVAQSRAEAEAHAAARRQAREVLRQSPDPAARLAAREHLARLKAQLGLGTRMWEARG